MLKISYLLYKCYVIVSVDFGLFLSENFWVQFKLQNRMWATFNFDQKIMNGKTSELLDDGRVTELFDWVLMNNRWPNNSNCDNNMQRQIQYCHLIVTL